MKAKNFSSLIATLILLSVAIYMYYTTGDYTNSTIWVIASPLFLSLHPVYRENPDKMKLTPKEHEKLRTIFNFARFSLFTLGMLMFLYQLFSDIL